MISKIDEYGKLGWITAVLAGFWLAWPIGLAVLAFMVGSGRLGNTCIASPGTWFNLGTSANDRRPPNWMPNWTRARPASTGNKAFDDYREDTLRRLEDEEREFQAFLDRLRKARDKSEFDAFMAERRDRQAPVKDVPDAA